MNADNEIFRFPGGVSLPCLDHGRTPASELAARELSANALALRLRVPSNRPTEIIRGRRSISAETALRPSRYFGTGAALWVNLPARYDVAMAEREFGAQIVLEVDAACPTTNRLVALPLCRAGFFAYWYWTAIPLSFAVRPLSMRWSFIDRMARSWHLVSKVRSWMPLVI